MKRRRIRFISISRYYIFVIISIRYKGPI